MSEGSKRKKKKGLLRRITRSNAFHQFIVFLLRYLGTAFIYLYGLTWKIERVNEDKSQHALFLLWHQNILAMYSRMFEGIAFLVSHSKDGDYITAPSEMFGFKAIRGSAARGGMKAAKEIIRVAKERSVLIVTDGPKGPAHVVKEGALFLAYYTKLPLVPIVMDVDRVYEFSSWDRFRFPKLFARIRIRYGDPIYIENKEDITGKYNLVQNAMTELTRINRLKNLPDENKI